MNNNASNQTLCCHWCGISLANATQVVYLNGNLPICGLCLLKASSQKGKIISLEKEEEK